MARKFDSGTVFGRLTVVKRFAPDVYKSLCVCTCGIEKIVWDAHLTNGKTVSCGCIRADNNRARSTHGHAPRKGETRTYRIWKNMKKRTTNPNCPDWKYYGGRGITLCERWFDYSNFLADMGESPKDLTIDRIDNDGNYEPNNCRWATRKEQRLNQG